MRLVALLLAVTMFPLLGSAIANTPATIDASASCAPAPGSAACGLSQSGTLSVVCAGQCDLVVTGSATATDGFPVKQVTTTLTMQLTGSASGGCTGLGLGATTCEVDLSFPFFIGSGQCARITVATDYARPPLSTTRVSRAFDACRVADEYTVAPR